MLCLPANLLPGTARLPARLPAVGAPGDWNHILKQIGMFSYTGLTKVGSAACMHISVICILPSQGQAS
jgi:aspartate/tyrosine/aromatic aminotransferase